MPFAVFSEYRGECSTLVLVWEDDISLLVEPEQVLMCEAHRVGGCRSVALIPYQPCVEFISKQAHDFLCLWQVLVYRPHEYIVLFIHEFVCDIAVQFHNSGDVHCLVWYCCSGAVRSGRFLSAPALLPRWVRVEDVVFFFCVENINLHSHPSFPTQVLHSEISFYPWFLPLPFLRLHQLIP